MGMASMTLSDCVSTTTSWFPSAAAATTASPAGDSATSRDRAELGTCLPTSPLRRRTQPSSQIAATWRPPSAIVARSTAWRRAASQHAGFWKRVRN